MSKNPLVDDFLSGLEHPFVGEIQGFRLALLASVPELTEQIKWNAPSFCVDGVDRVTFRLQPKNICELIFHRGAQKRDDVESFSFDDPSGLITWKTNDRGVIAFPTPANLDTRRDVLVDLVKAWISA